MCQLGLPLKDLKDEKEQSCENWGEISPWAEMIYQKFFWRNLSTLRNLSDSPVGQ